MADTITPNQDITFTITKTPPTTAQQKTIRRLMRMQPKIQKGLRDLQKQRKREDNVTHIRAGRPWTTRATATKLTHVGPGETFTIRVTPQIVPDIRSVEDFLDARPA